METFRLFLEMSEEEHDIAKTLSKLPKKYANLVKGYKIIFEKGNVLDQSSQHVGIIHFTGKTIHLAAPYHYGREFTLLHEIGHLVWRKLLTSQQKQKWTTLVKKTPKKVKDSMEELFAHGFADAYAKTKVIIHHHDRWERFIKALPESHE